MAQKRKPHLKTGLPMATSKRKRKDSNPTQVHPFEMVMVMGPTGKLRMEKRPK